MVRLVYSFSNMAEVVAFALEKNVKPRVIREKKNLLAEFQNRIRAQGVETDWPKGQF